ncbi:type IV pilin protein [Acinetobacter apis]|uniref:Type IV pilus assembly protein PilE n=1 Tax=Acinetobacter apis TaxID=1229165 RepID=A0A217EGK3_9GAMM|nr:type IV pilin protein [Acinetobacter apis]SNQ29474.1 type IV pilus assembly protein PilE [Acinetobacter apis]
MVKDQGFTLIEMLVVIGIIGVLVGIAYPSYANYMVSANREDVKVELTQIASKLTSYQQVNHSFSGASLNSNGQITSVATGNNRSNYPRQGTPLYTIELAVTTATSYTLTATPIARGRQDGDGVVCLDNLGQKFWQKGVGVCTLSSTSTWDN